MTLKNRCYSNAPSDFFWWGLVFYDIPNPYQGIDINFLLKQEDSTVVAKCLAYLNEVSYWSYEVRSTAVFFETTTTLILEAGRTPRP